MKKGWIRGCAFLVIGLLISQITHQSPTPEKNLNLWNAVPAFAIFALFMAATFSLGAYIRTSLKIPFFSGAENGLFDLSVGSVALYELAYLLTPFHLFQSRYSLLLWIFLSIFFGIGSTSIQARKWFDFARTKLAKFFLAIPMLIIVIKLLEGLQFHLHGDAYVVYLTGPRYWAETGNFNQFYNFTQLFITTTWESISAWGTCLMNLTGGSGLDLTQFFAQWSSGVLAIFGLILGAIALGQRLSQIFPIKDEYLPILGIAAAQVPVLQWTSNLAKNDTGIAFLGFAGFYLSIYLLPLSPLIAFVAGGVVGAAVIGKLTLVMIGLSITLYVFIFEKKHFIPFAIGGIAGALPVLTRNYVLTRNPVFPWYDQIFHTGLLSQSILVGVSTATQHTSQGLSQFINYFVELNHEVVLWPIFFVLILFFKNDRKKVFSVSWVPALAIILFTLTLRRSTETRYQNASLVIASVILCFLTFYAFTKLPKRFATIASIIFSIFLIGTSNITTFTLFQIGSSKFAPLKDKLASLAGGEGKLWIRQNLKTDSKILSIGDPHLYYVSDYKITEIVQSLEWDAKIINLSVADFEKSVRDSNFDYVYLANDVSFFDQLAKTNQFMQDSRNWNQQCKKLDVPKAQIWDLNCLRTAI